MDGARLEAAVNTRWRRHRENSGFAAFVQFHRCRQFVEEQVHMTAHQVVDRRGSAAIGHVEKLGVDRLLKHHGGQVRGRAIALGGVA